jgi:hypothetical protein
MSGHGRAERLGGFEIDDRLELDGVLNRQFEDPGTSQNAINIRGSPSEQIRDVSSVAAP